MAFKVQYILTETRDCGYHQDGRQSTMDYYAFGKIKDVQFEKDIPEKYRKTRFELARRGLLPDIFSAATTSCPSCNACIPLRINTDQFEITTRQQKKLDAFNKANGEVLYIENPVGFPALYKLFKKFLERRFPDSPMLQYSQRSLNVAIKSKTNLMVLKNSQNQLLGFSEIDRFENEAALDFIAYDPDHSDLYLGVISFLETVKWAQEQGISYVYIGPTNETASLKYKRYYSGLETFDGENWVPYNPKIHREGPDYDKIIQALPAQRKQDISGHPNFSNT